MIPLPKPRGFWDYGLFALVMTGVMLLLFWLEASDGIGWADIVLALAAAALFVLGIILARGGEKAKWIARPTWHVYLLATLGAFVLMFGAIFADSYFLHRADITSKRLGRDTIVAIAVIGCSGRHSGDVLQAVSCRDQALAQARAVCSPKIGPVSVIEIFQHSTSTSKRERGTSRNDRSFG